MHFFYSVGTECILIGNIAYTQNAVRRMRTEFRIQTQNLDYKSYNIYRV